MPRVIDSGILDEAIGRQAIDEIWRLRPFADEDLNLTGESPLRYHEITDPYLGRLGEIVILGRFDDGREIELVQHVAGYNPTRRKWSASITVPASDDGATKYVASESEITGTEVTVYDLDPESRLRAIHIGDCLARYTILSGIVEASAVLPDLQERHRKEAANN